MIKTAQNLLLGIFSLVLMLILGEIFLRILNPYKPAALSPSAWAIIPEESWIEYHPRLGWFHQKNKNAVLRKNSQTTDISINRMGLRSLREYSLPKPEGMRRAYLAGDSFTFGFGVQDQETLSSVLEKLDPNLEAFNLGVPGYGVDQISLLLKEFGFEFRPDFVFLILYPEDFWRAKRAFNDAGYGKPYFTLQSGGQLRLHHVPVPTGKNFLVGQFPELIHTHKWLQWFVKTRIYEYSQRALTRLKKLLGREDPDTSEEWVLGRAILSDSVQEIRRNKAEPVIVIVPPHRWLTGTTEPIRESLLRFGKRMQIPVIDLTPLFEKAILESSIDDYYIPDDHHWTAKGIHLVAETLLAFMNGSSPS